MKKILNNLLILIISIIFLQLSFGDTITETKTTIEEILFSNISNAKTDNQKQKYMKELFDYYISTNDYDDIITISNELLEFKLSKKWKYKIYYNLATSYFNTNKLELAVEAAREAEDLYKSKIEIKSLLGKIYQQNNLYELAIDEFNKILNSDYDNVEALISLGNIYFLQKNYKIALEYYQKADYTGKDLGIQSYINMAISAKEIGLINKSQDILETINTGNNVTVCLLLSNIYNINGDTEKAKKILIPLIKNNTNLEVCLNLAELYILSNEFEKAKDLILDFKSKNDAENIEALDLLLAESYKNLSQNQIAINLLKKVLKYTKSNFITESLSDILNFFEKR